MNRFILTVMLIFFQGVCLASGTSGDLLSGIGSKEMAKEAALVEDKQTIGERLNPFMTSQEEEIYKNMDNTIPIDYLLLSAIIYSPQTSKAIINGQILKVGDIIDNKKIVEINPDTVILKDAGGKYKICLDKRGQVIR